MTDEGLRALPVRHGGQLLGVLRLQERPGLALTLVEERLFAGLAAQAGLVLKWVGLRAELDDRRAELLVRSEEIKASRERLIETQDAERSRLERDLHDGAQQHLVALTVNLRLAHTIVGRSPDRAAAVLSEQAVAALVAIETLSALSRGIYPRQLADEGLGAALRSAVAGSAMPVTIDTDGMARLPAPVEAALYFCCMEAVQNAAKHSGAGTVAVRVDEDSSAVAAHRHRRRHRLRPGRRRGGIRSGSGQHARPPGRGRRNGGGRVLRAHRHHGDRRGAPDRRRRALHDVIASLPEQVV